MSGTSVNQVCLVSRPVRYAIEAGLNVAAIGALEGWFLKQGSSFEFSQEAAYFRPLKMGLACSLAVFLFVHAFPRTTPAAFNPRQFKLSYGRFLSQSLFSIANTLWQVQALEKSKEGAILAAALGLMLLGYLSAYRVFARVANCSFCSVKLSAQEKQNRDEVIAALPYFLSRPMRFTLAVLVSGGGAALASNAVVKAISSLSASAAYWNPLLGLAALLPATLILLSLSPPVFPDAFERFQGAASPWAALLSGGLAFTLSLFALETVAPNWGMAALESAPAFLVGGIAGAARLPECLVTHTPAAIRRCSMIFASNAVAEGAAAAPAQNKVTFAPGTKVGLPGEHAVEMGAGVGPLSV